jgi:hypothetical protein
MGHNAFDVAFNAMASSRINGFNDGKCRVER